MYARHAVVSCLSICAQLWILSFAYLSASLCAQLMAAAVAQSSRRSLDSAAAAIKRLEQAGVVHGR